MSLTAPGSRVDPGNRADPGSRVGAGDRRVDGGADAAPAASAPVLPGRTTVAERALRAVAQQAAASAFGVPRDRVSVHLASAAGGLALRVAAPLAVPDLDDSAAVRTGQPVLERVAEIQRTLLARVAELTGRAVTRVDVTVNGAIIPPRKRVR